MGALLRRAVVAMALLLMAGIAWRVWPQPELTHVGAGYAVKIVGSSYRDATNRDRVAAVRLGLTPARLGDRPQHLVQELLRVLPRDSRHSATPASLRP